MGIPKDKQAPICANIHAADDDIVWIPPNLVEQTPMEMPTLWTKLDHEYSNDLSELWDLLILKVEARIVANKYRIYKIWKDSEIKDIVGIYFEYFDMIATFNQVDDRIEMKLTHTDRIQADELLDTVNNNADTNDENSNPVGDPIYVLPYTESIDDFNGYYI